MLFRSVSQSRYSPFQKIIPHSKKNYLHITHPYTTIPKPKPFLIQLTYIKHTTNIHSKPFLIQLTYVRRAANVRSKPKSNSPIKTNHPLKPTTHLYLNKPLPYQLTIVTGKQRRGSGNLPGEARRENVGMSSDKTCEKHVRRKPKVFWAMLINSELVGP